MPKKPENRESERDKAIRLMAANGMTRGEMAEVLKCDRSIVTKRILALGIENVPPTRTPYTKSGSIERSPPLPKDEIPPIQVAHMWLGKRLEERPSGFWLDGFPKSIHEVMQEVNRMRKAMGVEQEGHERWRV